MGLLVAATAVTRTAFRSRYLYDIDSVNFALAMERFESEIGDGQQPGKERHRTVKIVVRNCVDPLRTLEKSVIVRDEASGEEKRGDSPEPEMRHIENADVAEKASRIESQAQVGEMMCHRKGGRPWAALIIAPKWGEIPAAKGAWSEFHTEPVRLAGFDFSSPELLANGGGARCEPLVHLL